MTRPRIISFICILGFISVVFSFPQVFSPAIKKVGVFAPAVYGAIVAAQFISFVGLWHFKQWGALGFLVAAFSKAYFSLSVDDTGAFFYIFIVITLFSAFFILRHYKSMDPNF